MMTTRPDPRDHLPLRPVDFLILLALVDDDRHGYSLVREVNERSGGTHTLLPGNFYAVLRRLMARGLLKESARRHCESDRRRRYYTITELGRAVVRAEAARLRKLVAEAQSLELITPVEGTSS